MIAVFPGSFDPITKGHIDIINSSLQIFDKLVIGVGINQNKKNMFTIEQRIQFIQSIFSTEKRILIKKYSGLTITFCKQENANHIIRGVRNNTDFEYEQAIAFSNQILDNSIQTLFINPEKEHAFISSTIVREIIKTEKKNDSKLNHFLHATTISKIYNKT